MLALQTFSIILANWAKSEGNLEEAGDPKICTQHGFYVIPTGYEEMAVEKEQKGTSRVILVKKIIMRDGKAVSITYNSINL